MTKIASLCLLLSLGTTIPIKGYGVRKKDITRKKKTRNKGSTNYYPLPSTALNTWRHTIDPTTDVTTSSMVTHQKKVVFDSHDIWLVQKVEHTDDKNARTKEKKWVLVAGAETLPSNSVERLRNQIETLMNKNNQFSGTVAIMGHDPAP